ncbi:MAG: hypothetical protein QOF59_2059, partial [Actinomycetota bacterium]|nr:hypothetical protein [Actinomycetota bacterium]
DEPPPHATNSSAPSAIALPHTQLPVAQPRVLTERPIA